MTTAALHRTAIALFALAFCGCATPVPSPTLEVTTVRVGEKVTLIVESDGTPPLTYRWEKDGQPLPHGDGPKLEIGSAQLSDSGAYACIVSNSAGAVSEPFRLRVVER
jgi:hypothetical protein